MRERMWVMYGSMSTELWSVFNATWGWKYPKITPFQAFPSFHMTLK